jgi:hypothetical protein
MGDFEKEYAEQVRGQRQQVKDAAEKSDTEKQTFVRKDKLLKELGPLFWAKFREILKAKCDGVNTTLGETHFTIHPTNPNGIRVRKHDPVDT